ncbi:hypothetical protein FHT76_007495 [Rhizobium sp. BK176]|nr:hypothetical protein [Rhizobium sp. BK399]MCS3743931.1 hypothetical protein [Rhizobium sp. BK661]MCS4095775.1 hypothetical protein [Rhizobium sp. BK176]
MASGIKVSEVAAEKTWIMGVGITILGALCYAGTAVLKAIHVLMLFGCSKAVKYRLPLRGNKILLGH